MRILFRVGIAVVVAFFVYAIALGVIGLPGTQQQLKEAPFIDDGEVHPEYENETVIVCGQLTAEGSCYDDYTYVTINAPCVTRYVEMLKEGRDEDGNPCLVWKPLRSDDVNEELRQKMFDGNLRLGGYKLDESLVSLLAPGREVGVSMFKSDELEFLKSHRVYPITSAGTFYLSEVPSIDFKNTVYDWRYESYRRVHYKMLDPNTELQYSIVGITRGDTLRRNYQVDTQPIFEGAKTKNDVVKGNLLYTILGMLIVGAICIGLLIYAGSIFF